MGEKNLGVKVVMEKLQKKDLHEVLNLYASLELSNEKLIDPGSASMIFDKMTTYPDYKIYIAKLEDKIVGVFSLLILDNIAHLGRSLGLVESVVVHDNYRSMGIGRKMMEFAIQKCKEGNCYKMSLSSNLIREGAHSFYEQLGFKKHGYSFLIEI